MTDDSDKTTHPAYGIISIHRTSGGARLFRSDFEHQHYITIDISTAYETPGYGVKGNVYNDAQIISLAMSEAQFARMITSLNVGCGTPCTLERVGVPPALKPFEGKQIPRVEREDLRETQKDKSRRWWLSGCKICLLSSDN